MNCIFKLFLTLNTLLLSLVVFCVDKNITLGRLYSRLLFLPNIVSYLVYVLAIIFITWVSLVVANFLSTDTIKTGSIITSEPANDAFLPSYLGYFFVALSITNLEVFVFVFSVICIFVYFSRISYFNPVFFLFGFNFFYVTTESNEKILLITKKEIKNPIEVSFGALKRINNYTFIDMER